MAKQLRLVLVTPEKTLLDETVDKLRFPLFDGSMGVLPGRAPLVGRLGYGELLVGAGAKKYYIDGGFVQIKGEVVTLLTNRAMLAGEINLSDVEANLSEVSKRKPANTIEQAAKTRDLERARQMLRVGRSA